MSKPHATGAPRPDPERPSYAEAARTLLARSRHGVLATLDTHGFPYTSVVELLPLAGGDTLFLLSDLAEHTKNLKRDVRASLLVAAGLGGDAPLAEERASLLGTLRAETGGAHRAAYVARHPGAARYADFSDFRFYRLTPERVYLISGFGRMGWAEAASYRQAKPDPLVGAAPGIVAHMNDDHEHNLVGYAKAFAGLAWAEHATMQGVDRYGFDTEVRGGPKVKTIRLNFSGPVTSPDQVRRELVRLAHEARAVLEGER